MNAPALALADRIRALPRAERLAFYRSLPPGLLASARYAFGLWARPAQALPEPAEPWTLDITLGERGAGKSFRARALFLREIFAGRATRPRIIAATDAVLEATVIHGPSGIMAWLPPHMRPAWTPTKGFAGELVFRVDGQDVRCLCCSAQAPGQAIGIGIDLDWRDDPAGWVVSCGQSLAERMWIEASKSCREGLGRAIVATTIEGAAFIERLMSPEETSGARIVDLGAVEENAGNLSPAYIRTTVADLRRRGEWDARGDGPFADLDFGKPPIRVPEAGELVEIAIPIDPADGAGARSDEWGIGAMARRRDRHVVVLEDASGVHDDTSAGRAVFDLLDRWAALYPRTPVKLVGEANRGGERLRSALRAAWLERELERLARDPQALARPMPDVGLVTTRDGKARRAGPVVALYRSGLLHHVAGLSKLEGQQRAWDPSAPEKPRSDDRLDMVLLGAHYLADLGAARKPTADEVSTAAITASRGLREFNRKIPAPAIGGRTV